MTKGHAVLKNSVETIKKKFIQFIEDAQRMRKARNKREGVCRDAI